MIAINRLKPSNIHKNKDPSSNQARCPDRAKAYQSAVSVRKKSVAGIQKNIQILAQTQTAVSSLQASQILEYYTSCFSSC